MRRFGIRRTRWLRPLLWLFGAAGGNSYLQLDAASLRVRFGPLFDSTVDLSEVESVAPMRWPFLLGLGWRTDFRGRIALVGSYGGVVEIRLKRPQRLRFILPFWRINCDRLVVSLEKPGAFTAAMEARPISEPGS